MNLNKASAIILLEILYRYTKVIVLLIVSNVFLRNHLILMSTRFLNLIFLAIDKLRDIVEGGNRMLLIAFIGM